MAEIRFNSPNGFTVGDSPINSIDGSNNATFLTLAVSGGSVFNTVSAVSLAVSGAVTFSTIPTSPTPSVDNNSTQSATTAYFIGQKSSVAPLMASVATVGVSTKWSPADHIHPSDTSRLTVANPSATGQMTIAGGSISVDAPILNLTQTWNNAGTAFSGLKFVLTDSASNSSSRVLDLRSGSNIYAVDKNFTIIQVLSNPNLARDIVGVTGSRHVREYQDLNDYNVSQNIGGATTNTENFEWGYTWNAKWDIGTSSYVKDRSNANDHAVMMRTDKKFRQQWYWSNGTTAGSSILWVKKVDFDFTNSTYAFAGNISTTTLDVSGNINTGTWNATPISIAKGGTGITSLGTANQVMGVNAAGNAFEYKTITSSDSSLSVSHVTPGVIDIKLVGTLPGNINFSGDLSVGGAEPNHKFLVKAATGNTDIKGTLALASDFTVNTNKFTVAAASGNTLVAGTLGVTGTGTFTNAISVGTSGTFGLNVTVGNGLTTLLLQVNGSSSLTGPTTITNGNFSVKLNDVTTFYVVAATGNTTINGSISVGTSATVGTTLGVTGATTLSSTLAVAGNFAIATNKFTVNATSGNTLVAGTLNVAGVSTLGSVSATSVVTPTATVTNSIVRDNGGVDNAKVWLTTTNTTVAGTYAIASFVTTDYKSVEFQIQSIFAGSSIFQRTSVVVVHNGAGTINYSEFGGVEVGGIASVYAVVANGANIELRVTTTVATGVFKVIATAIK